MIERRVLAQLPEVVHELTDEIGEHIEQLVDVKLMVIKRFDPELANRVFLDMGQRELTFIKNFGFVFGFALGIPVAVLTHFVTAWWLLPILGVVIGYVTNWVALWMIYEPRRAAAVGTAPRPRAVHPPPARRRRGVRHDRRRRDPHGVGVRQRAAPRAAVRPHAGAGRGRAAPGDRPRGRARAARGRRWRWAPAAVRVDPRVVRHRADRSDDGAAHRPRVQPGAVGDDA